MGPKVSLMGEESGAQGRNRTTDTAIFSRMLYQLSYLGRMAAFEFPVGGGKPAGAGSQGRGL